MCAEREEQKERIWRAASRVTKLPRLAHSKNMGPTAAGGRIRTASHARKSLGQRIIMHYRVVTRDLRFRTPPTSNRALDSASFAQPEAAATRKATANPAGMVQPDRYRETRQVSGNPTGVGKPDRCRETRLAPENGLAFEHLPRFAGSTIHRPRLAARVACQGEPILA